MVASNPYDPHTPIKALGYAGILLAMFVTMFGLRRTLMLAALFIGGMTLMAMGTGCAWLVHVVRRAL